MQFNFELPSVTIAQRSRKFADKYRLCDNALCNLQVICISLICANDVFLFFFNCFYFIHFSVSNYYLTFVPATVFLGRSPANGGILPPQAYLEF